MRSEPLIQIQMHTLPVSRKAGWGQALAVCARRESISGGDLQPFTTAEPPPPPHPLRKDSLLEGSVTGEVAGGGEGASRACTQAVMGSLAWARICVARRQGWRRMRSEEHLEDRAPISAEEAAASVHQRREVTPQNRQEREVS